MSWNTLYNIHLAHRWAKRHKFVVQNNDFICIYPVRFYGNNDDELQMKVNAGYNTKGEIVS